MNYLAKIIYSRNGKAKFDLSENLNQISLKSAHINELIILLHEESISGNLVYNLDIFTL